MLASSRWRVDLWMRLAGFMQNLHRKNSFPKIEFLNLLALVQISPVLKSIPMTLHDGFQIINRFDIA